MPSPDPDPTPPPPAVVLPSRVDPAGLTGPTYSQARRASWRRVATGIYVPRSASRDLPRQRVAEAAAVIPGYGGVTGWGALCWQHVEYADGTDHHGDRLPVSLAIGGGNLRPHPDVAVSKERLHERELTVVDGVSVTQPVRSVCFEARYAESVRVAVRWLDLTLASDLVSIAECSAYADTLNGWTGVPQLREALTLCHENVWSPPETLMRFVWADTVGVAGVLCNVPIFNPGGKHIGTPDLMDPVAGVVGEYDGKLHLEGRRRNRDVKRYAAFRAAGLEHLTMMAADTRDTTDVAARLREAYGRALYAPESARLWTLTRPHWWVDTSTVERRRALSQEERERWLRRGAA